MPEPSERFTTRPVAFAPPWLKNGSCPIKVGQRVVATVACPESDVLEIDGGVNHALGTVGGSSTRLVDVLDASTVNGTPLLAAQAVVLKSSTVCPARKLFVLVVTVTCAEVDVQLEIVTLGYAPSV